MRPKPDPIDWDEALQLYREGRSAAQIADEFGYRVTTVRRELRRRGAERKRKWKSTALRYGTPLQHLWFFLRGRCEDSRHRDYRSFGARGVRFAEAWRDFDAFYGWAMRAGFEPGLHLDRKDPDGNFEPRNCRWVSVQKLRARLGESRPPRSWITAFGERKGPAQWSRDPRCKISPHSLVERIDAGWPPEEAVAFPPGASPSRRVRPPRRRAWRKPPARIDWDEARRLYVEKELSEHALAERYAASLEGIRKGLERLGVQRRPRPALYYDSEATRLRSLWYSLHRRCADPRYVLYRSNGALGVRVAPQWKELGPFLAWARASGARRGLVLIRRDDRRGYGPANCAWARRSEASRLRRTPPSRKIPAVRLITAFGETKGITAWSRDPRCSVKDATIGRRLVNGWTPEEAIARPPENRAASDYAYTELEAFGVVKSKSEWLRDPRCRVRAAGLDHRLRRGWSPEAAIATPAYHKPRVRGARQGPPRSRARRR